MKPIQAVPIAVIGMACRFPNHAADIQSFWEVIESKTDCIGPIPSNRWDSSLLDGLNLTLETQFAKVGGFIESVFDFDSEFFGTSSTEALQIDPQQRMLLELAWRCMEDAALSPKMLERCSTGVYVGVINHDYERLVLADRSGINAYSGLGRSTSIAANRISYFFNLSGPSIAIDTACSSSLTAVDAACNALSSGSANLAFAGGANAILAPESYIEFSKAAMLSKSGRCQAFDANADGFVRAEGGGLILLKRLSDALINKDRIYATIIASSVNQDGKTAGIMAPDPAAQQAMMRDALSKCGLDRKDIGYVEAHGTGTQVGDTIEAKSLGAVYGHPNLFVGSVKSNIGHTEAAAGIAGLIKAIQAVYFGKIPPNLHFATPNPKIDFESWGIRVPTELQSWCPPHGGARIAAVNSFGFGGANAHVIVCQAPNHHLRQRQKDASDVWIPVSARNSNALDELRSSLENEISGPAVQLEYLAYSANRMPRFQFRSVMKISADSKKGSAKLLESINQANSGLDQSCTDENPIAFVFSGIGKKWDGEGSKLYAKYPVFKATVDLCDELFSPVLKIRQTFVSGDPFEADNLVKAHAIHFTLQISLYELWKSWAVQAKAVIGHSMGEVAAACSAGYITLPEAVELVIDRASRIEHFCNQGLMLAASLHPKSAREIIGAHQLNISLAAINSQNSVTVAGPGNQIQKFANVLDQANTFYRVLEVPVPFHSSIIESARTKSCTLSGAIDASLEKPTWYSSVTGTKIKQEFQETEFWWNNFLDPVKFHDAVTDAIQSGHRVFVEIGPHASLHYNLHECFDTQNVTGQSFALFSMHKDRAEDSTMKASAAALFNLGVDVDFHQFNHSGAVCQFPTTPFARQSYRKAAPRVQDHFEYPNKPCALLTNQRTSRQHLSWEIPLKVAEWPWLENHQLQGKLIFPAAGYIEAALQAASLKYQNSSIELRSLQFSNLLEVQPDNETSLTFNLQNCAFVQDFQIFSNASSTHAQTTHCHGQIEAGQQARPQLPVQEILSTLTTHLSFEQIDERFKTWNFMGDTSNWGLSDVRIDGHKRLMAKLEQKNPANSIAQAWLLHPSLLDLCFRCVVGIADPLEPVVPYEIESLKYWHDKPDSVFCYIQVLDSETGTLVIDIDIASAEGTVIASISKLHLRQFSGHKSANVANAPSLIAFKRQWKIAQTELSIGSQFDCSPTDFRVKMEEYSSNLTQSQQRWRHYEKINPALTEITVAYIGQALRQVGIKVKPGRISLGDLFLQCRISHSQSDQFNALLKLLSVCGYLEFEQSVDGLTPETGIHWLKELNAKPAVSIAKFFTMSDAAQYMAELQLISRCGKQLLPVLTGKRTGIDVLFPEGASDQLENFYYGAPTCRIYNQILSHSVELLLNSWRLARPCRILEVGSGTGALLSLLTPILRRYEIEYTFTDVSSLFVRRAKSRFGHLNFVRFGQLDLNADPNTQGYELESFDMILAADALHLTNCPKQVLEHLTKLLHPGGNLTFVELTDEPAWAPMVFGMLRDWWPRSKTHRSPYSPCLSQRRWLKLIDQIGIDRVAVLSDRPGNNAGIHSVFVARKKGQPIVANVPVETIDCDRLIFSNGGEFSCNFIEHFDSDKTLRVAAGTKYCFDNNRIVIDPNTAQHFVQLIDDLRQIKALPDEILFLWNFAATEADSHSFELALRSSSVLAIASLLKAFDYHGLTPSSLTLVSSNAHRVENQANLSNCLEAAIWGLGRTLRNEYPGLDVRLIDIDPSTDTTGKNLFQFLQSNSDLPEVCLRNSIQFVPFDTKLNRNNLTIAPPRYAALSIQRSAGLDSLSYSLKTLPGAKDTEVVIEVAVCALNFRDVMIGLDALPASSVEYGYMQRSIGIECTGTIVRVGNQVKDLAVGERVVALAKNSLASHTITNEKFVHTLIDNQSLTSYCALPTAYVTALYCLQTIIDLKATDRVLIHCGSGGVGLALINLAKKSGCEVYATAGTVDKIAFLNLFGIDRVADSRSDSFVKDIDTWSNGNGCDVIVNMLGGELAAANKQVLANDGTFIELGKYEDREQVHNEIQQFKPNAKIATVDIDRLWLENPDQIEVLFKNAIKKVSSGDLPALPYQVFSTANAKEAFRQMAAAKHIGKIVLTSDRRHSHAESLDQETIIRNNSTYIVTGGTRGFGLATANWLAEQGAQHVVVIGRTPSNSNKLDSVRIKASALGCQIVAIAVDVCDLEQFQSKLEATCQELPPVRGVFHCAMELEDSAVINLDQERFYTSTRAKVVGAWNLYQLTKHLSLDFFVLYSSATSVLAPAGQAAYAAANAIIDSFAAYLKESGVPALAVNWGAVSDYGRVADLPIESTAVGKQFGIDALPADEMLATLNGLLKNRDIAQAIVVGSCSSTDDGHSAMHGFGSIPKGKQPISSAKDRAGLKVDSDSVLDCISRILDIPKNEINIDDSIANLGIDSLLAVELSHHLRASCQIEISAASLLDKVTTKEVIEFAGLRDPFNSG